MIGLAQPLQLRGRPAEAYGPSMSTPIDVASPLQGEQPLAGLPQIPGDPHGQGEAAPNPVIGIICAGDLAVHRNEVKAAISRGLAERPDAVWVCIESRSDRMTHDLMISLDIEPVILPMNDAWRKRKKKDESAGSPLAADMGASGPALTPDDAQAETPQGVAWSHPSRGINGDLGGQLSDPSYDLRRQWRDLEMLHLCDELVIFHKASGSSPWRDRVKSGLYDRLYLVEIGPSNKPKTKEHS